MKPRKRRAREMTKKKARTDEGTADNLCNHWQSGGPVRINNGNSWFYFDKRGIDVVCAGVIGRITWGQLDKARKILLKPTKKRGRKYE